MKLPVIRHLLKFVEENDADFLTESLDVLDHLIDALISYDQAEKLKSLLNYGKG